MSGNSITAERSEEAGTAFTIILAISFCHVLNDMMQSLLTASYPLFKANYGLDFGQVGLLTLAFQVTASFLQPVVGLYTDRHPLPYSLTVGMCSTLTGILVLATAGNYTMLVAGAALIGIGSSVFHPESSRVARLASGGRHGLAQAIFQVGGNFGAAIGPLLAAFVVLPHGQMSIVWFGAAALVGITILYRVGGWYKGHQRRAARRGADAETRLPRRTVVFAVLVLIALIFSKYIYMASLSSYYTFYLIHKFGVGVQTSQILLFVFLGSVALGTVLGGPIVDWFGTRLTIWFSILGVLPFTLALPYAGFEATIALTVAIGLVLASAFPAIMVFAQELMPGRIGLVGGIFYGIAFGIGGIGAALLGDLIDVTGIDFVYRICSYLPAIGLLTALLPHIGRGRRDQARKAQPAH